MTKTSTSSDTKSKVKAKVAKETKQTKTQDKGELPYSFYHPQPRSKKYGVPDD